MPLAHGPYGESLALLTDLYQLTMAYGYWHHDKTDREAVFHLFFRESPFGGGYAIAAGLEQAIEFVDGLSFGEDARGYLGSLQSDEGRPLFSREFLDYLGAVRIACDIDAVPEGTVVFPNEPLLRVRGPLLHCQLLETALLNIVNFQTLIATKAARVVQAAGGDPVIEFGLRRAPGPDGGLSASRAAYVGGCIGTSNVLAGMVFGIPVKGTHAHSWVMAFDSEEEAFRAYAEAMPDNCVFLVDTYDTLDGVDNAIAAAERLRQAGHEMVGIRLDSGDLAWLSREARRRLDQAGFPDAVVVGSNELDEHLIADLKAQGAAIGVWGVGTKLATGDGQGALGGVYKLSAIRTGQRAWEYKVKVGDQAAKVTNPGILQVRRYLGVDGPEGDMIFNTESPPVDDDVIVDPGDPTRRKRFEPGTAFEELLVPVFRGGALVYELPALSEIRERTFVELERFDPSIRRLVNPHAYPVGLERGLHDVKTRLILEARGFEAAEGR